MIAPALDRLRSLPGFKGNPEQFTARCPGHDDHANSLQVKLKDDGKVLVTCFAGCGVRDILAPIDCTPRDLYPPKAPKPKAKKSTWPTGPVVARYNYTDATGQVLYQVLRFEPKDFRPVRPDGAGGWKAGLGNVERVLYHLPDVLNAKAEGQTIYLCEGEKDCNNLAAAFHVCTTTNSGGAAKWSATDAATLAGCNVVILPDNDDAGVKGAWRRADSIPGSVVVMLPGLPAKGDVTDWLAQGGTLDELEALRDMAHEKPVERPVEAIDRPDIDPLSELANAYRFKERVKGKIVNDPRLGWMAYPDGYWKSGERDAAKEAAELGAVIRAEGHAATDDPDLIKSYYSAARRATSARGVDSTLKLARVLPGVNGENTEWDKNETLVNFKDCTVDISTLTKKAHDPADYITRQIPHPCDLNAKCPVWDAHVYKICRGDQVRMNYLKFAFGYSMTGSMKHQIFFIAHGKPGFAKSTTIEAIMYAAGPYADAVSHDVVLDQHHPGHACTLAALYGLRMGLVSELPEGARWNEAQVKRLATGDTLSARYIGCNPFSFKSTMKLWVNCNDRPEFRDGNGGMARRIRCIPFDVDMTGPDRDLDIDAKLRAEAPGILRWLMEGAHMAYHGEPEIPEVVKFSSREYVRQNDILGNFIEECCEVDTREHAEVGATYERFKQWGGDLTKRRLGTLLLPRFDQYSDGKKRYWVGFQLR